MYEEKLEVVPNFPGPCGQPPGVGPRFALVGEAQGGGEMQAKTCTKHPI